MSRFEKKLKNEMNDKIKLVGMEALVPVEFEKHLILNSSRLRTLEDARREIVTNVEAKFCSKNLDSKPSDTGLREYPDVGAVNSRQSKEKEHPVCAMGIFSVMEHIFNETAMQARTLARNRLAKANQSKSWSKSKSSITGKGKGKENNGKSKGQSKGTKGAIQVSTGSGNGKTLMKTGISSLEILKPETSSEN